MGGTIVDSKSVPITALRLIMPSAGDMELLNQEGGTIDLEPIYYGSESMGPHIQIVQGHKDGAKFIVDKILCRYRLKVKGEEGKVELKRGQG